MERTKNFITELSDKQLEQNVVLLRKDAIDEISLIDAEILREDVFTADQVYEDWAYKSDKQSINTYNGLYGLKKIHRKDTPVLWDVKDLDGVL